MSDISWLDRTEYPFESHYLDVEAGRLHYVDQGAGAPIVMVHGNPTWSFLYRHLIKQLSPHYRCVAPDHIGFGLSDKPVDWAYLPHQHTENLTALIDHLGLKDITLVVQDWGGPTGLAYAIAHPENVRRLVILNTWLWPVNKDPYYIGFSGFMGGPIGRHLIKRHNFFVNGVMSQSYGDKKRLTPAIHRHYSAPLSMPAERKGCWVFPGQIVGASEWLAEIWSKRAVLRPMSKLIVWGTKDIAFRENELKTWSREFPEAQILRQRGVGHYVQEELGPGLGDIVARFLDTHPVT